MAIKGNRIHVPLEIMVSGCNGEPFARFGFGCTRASAAILNEQRQALVKIDSDDNYSVWCGGKTSVFPNDNEGTNYFLAKRKRPKAGRLYFATDYEEDSSKFQENLKNIENYVILINKDTYVFWKPIAFPTEKTLFEISHCRTWQFNNWKFFYEVKKRKTKKQKANNP
ncbi:MAG: hypothetical protein QME12_00370 [Nanoarchaeota archaeon]|nr:hypothetical protein [Nanoarchaeota archaeon]